MKRRFIQVAVAFIAGLSLAHAQSYPPLGTENNFTVLAGTEVTSAGNTVVNGALGISPGTTLTGFPPGVVNGSVHLNNTTAQNAQADLSSAYSNLEGQSATANLSGQNLGGRTLQPGVYKFSGSASLDGVLTLDAAGNPDGIFIFQVGANFSVAAGARVVLQEGARARNVHFQVGATAAIGAGATFKGSILAKGGITAADGAVIQGRLMSLNSFVQFTNTTISTPLPTSLADLELIQTVSPDPYYQGETLTYTIRIRNLGPSTESNVLVRDVLPEGVAYVSSSASVSNYNPNTGIWPIETFPNGASHTLTIVVRLTARGFITNTATIAAEGRDENSTNNASTITVCAAPRAPGVISGPGSVCRGSTDNVYRIESMEGVTQYKWTVPDGWTITAGQGTTSVMVAPGTNTNSGTIVVTAVNVCGEGLPSSRTVFSAATEPGTLGPITGSANPCAGSTTTYSVAEVARAERYTWTLPADWSIISGAGTSAITVSVGALSGTIKVVASNGCGISNEVSLAVSPSLAKPVAPAAIQGNLNVCAGVVGTVYSVLSVAGATSYNWTVPAGWAITSGQGTTSITVTPGTASGTVSVVASNSCGASPASSLSVTVSTARPAAPDLITGNSVPCAGSAGNTYSVAPVSGATSYTWTVPSGWAITAGQGTTSVTVTAGQSNGNISVSASNSCGASSASTLAVRPATEVPPTPGPITGTTVPCQGTSGNAYSVAPVSGASSYTWTVPSGWAITAGQGTTSVTVTAGASGGIVSVKASNGCGVSPASTLAVEPAEAVPASPGPITGNSVPCQNTSGNTYSVAPVSGVSAYTWEVPSGWAITAGQGTASITVTTDGSREGVVSVRATNGCGTSPASTLSVKPASTGPFALGPISGSQLPCVAGTGITYTVAPIAETSAYTWTVPSGWVITAGQGTPSITVTAGSTSGVVAVKASNGCGESPAQTLEVTPTTALPPTPEPITGPGLLCAGQTSVTYSVPAIPSASSYTWTVPSGWAITAGQGTPSITVTAGSAGGTVAVKAANGCGESPAQTLEVRMSTAVPAAPGTISGNSVPCAGSAGNIYSVEAVPGASSYLWAVPTGWAITAGQGTPSITVTAGPAGGTVAVKAANGCGEGVASTRTLTVAASPPATPGPITGNTNPCKGSTNLTYSVAAVSGASSYAWTVPAGWTITSGQGTMSVTVTADGSGGVVAVKAANGCGTSAESTLATTLSATAPTALGAITGNSIPCRNTTGNTYAVAVISTASSFVWTVPAGWMITNGQGTSSITVTAGSAEGTVSVIAFNDCGASAPSTFAVSPATVAPAALGPVSGSKVPCVGNTSATYSVAAVSGASSYTWAVPAGWAITAGQGTPSITVTVGQQGGDVSVRASNGCGATDAKTLAVAPAAGKPEKPGIITGDVSVCIGQTGFAFSVAAVGGAETYTWAVPAGWAITAGQGTPSITVAPGETGGTVSVNASNGCGDSDKATLQVAAVASAPAKPEAISGTTVPCTGINATASTYRAAPVSGATAYTWTVPAGWTIIAGQGTPEITVSAGSAEGQVSVVASNGCGNSPAATLAVKAAAAAPGALGAIAGEKAVCRGNAGVTYSVAAVPDVATYTWTVPAGWAITAGQGTRSITVTVGSGAGTVRVKAANGCGESAAVTLDVWASDGAPKSLGEIVGDQVPCVNSTTNTYKVPGAGEPLPYTWTVPEGWDITAGQGTAEITVQVGAGAGTVSVVASNGCGLGPVSTLEVTPALTPPPAPGPISGDNSLCSGQQSVSYSIEPVPNASSYTWTLPDHTWTILSGQGTRTITVNAGTTAGTLVVTASNGCGTGGPSTLATTFLPAAAPPEQIVDESAPCKGLVFSVPEVRGATSYTWTVPSGWSILSGQGTARVSVKANSPAGEVSVVANNSSCVSLPVSILADAAKGESELVLPNVFSPNGDGINDFWAVKNLDKFPENELVILNRWGSEVYRQKTYLAQWNGSGLSAGTYYYVLRVKECDGTDKTYKGFVMIMK